MPALADTYVLQGSLVLTVTKASPTSDGTCPLCGGPMLRGNPSYAITYTCPAGGRRDVVHQGCWSVVCHVEKSSDPLCMWGKHGVIMWLDDVERAAIAKAVDPGMMWGGVGSHWEVARLQELWDAQRK